MHVTCSYLHWQLRVVVLALLACHSVTCEYASTTTCEYRFLQVLVSCHCRIAPATVRQLHVSLPVCRLRRPLGAGWDWPQGRRDPLSIEHAAPSIWHAWAAAGRVAPGFFFWKAYLSIKQPLTAHGPIDPQVSSRHDVAPGVWRPTMRRHSVAFTWHCL